MASILLPKSFGERQAYRYRHVIYEATRQGCAPRGTGPPDLPFRARMGLPLAEVRETAFMPTIELRLLERQNER